MTLGAPGLPWHARADPVGTTGPVHQLRQLQQLGGNLRFAFRHFPLTGIHLASGQVLGTPTLFIDGVLHRHGYDPPALLAALTRSPDLGDAVSPARR